MKMIDLRSAKPAESIGQSIVAVPDDCSTDANRGPCLIRRYKNEYGAIITEQDWCTKHGKERGFYK